MLTGRSKSKTMFAKWSHSGKGQSHSYFVKGPIKNAVEAERQTLSEQIKVILGLPHADLEVRRYTEGLFMISKCIVNIDHCKFEYKTTKIETNAKVSTNEVGHYVDEIENKKMQQQVLLSLAFRKIVGANDTCKRNFIVKGAHVFSVDDEAKFKLTNYMWSKPVTKF